METNIDALRIKVCDLTLNDIGSNADTDADTADMEWRVVEHLRTEVMRRRRPLTETVQTMLVSL